jgi:hypothetical protein
MLESMVRLVMFDFGSQALKLVAQPNDSEVVLMMIQMLYAPFCRVSLFCDVKRRIPQHSATLFT